MAQEPQDRNARRDDEAILTLKRSTARFALEILCAIIVGVIVAFAMPPIVEWLADLPAEAWWVIGVAVAVVGAIWVCSRRR